MKKVILFMAMLWTVTLVYCQNISNVDFNVQGNSIEINYTVFGLAHYQELNTELYVSPDGGKTFKGPMKSVKGDIGKMTSNGAKKMVWDFSKEMDLYEVDLVVDVRGTIIEKASRNFVGYQYSNGAFLGGIVGKTGEKYGYYASLRTTLSLGSDYQADKYGTITEIYNTSYTYTGEVENRFSALSVGALYRVKPWLYAKAGPGIAHRNTRWVAAIDNDDNAKVKITDYSGFRFCMEAGALLKVKKYLVGADVIYLAPRKFTYSLSFSVMY